MNSINLILVLAVHLQLCTISKSRALPLGNYDDSNDDEDASSFLSEDIGGQRIKRDRDADMKNFHWSFSVESPSVQVDQPSSFSRFAPQAQQQNKMPEVSVQFFDGFKSFGAPGEQESRLKLEGKEEDGRAEGWNRNKSVFIRPDKSCCGPHYPFRTCCQM